MGQAGRGETVLDKCLRNWIAWDRWSHWEFRGGDRWGEKKSGTSLWLGSLACLLKASLVIHLHCPFCPFCPWHFKSDLPHTMPQLVHKSKPWLPAAFLGRHPGLAPHPLPPHFLGLSCPCSCLTGCSLSLSVSLSLYFGFKNCQEGKASFSAFQAFPANLLGEEFRFIAPYTWELSVGPSSCSSSVVTWLRNMQSGGWCPFSCFSTAPTPKIHLCTDVYWIPIIC